MSEYSPFNIDPISSRMSNHSLNSTNGKALTTSEWESVVKQSGSSNHNLSHGGITPFSRPSVPSNNQDFGDKQGKRSQSVSNFTLDPVAYTIPEPHTLQNVPINDINDVFALSSRHEPRTKEHMNPTKDYMEHLPQYNQQLPVFNSISESSRAQNKSHYNYSKFARGHEHNL